MIKPNTYKIFSILLSYPDSILKNNIDIIYSIIKENDMISTENILKITDLITFIKNNNLIHLQEYYVSIFDRKKDFSLYIFEHIHGDSRERGMAMIDLMELYKKSNFIIYKKTELPDYLPLFLEYLSVIPQEKAQILLGDIINIISILSRRLTIISSYYSAIFTTLESISPIKCDSKIIEQIITNFNTNKHTFNIDKEWEEPKVF